MKLIHCKKCGAAIVTENGLVERMQDYIHELNEKARKSKDGRVAKSYLAEAASVTKMMKGILHNTTELEKRRVTCASELAEIIKYIRSNGLISDEKLSELRKNARKKAKEKNSINQKELDRIYAEWNKLDTPFNRTKRDDTAKKAIRNVLSNNNKK